MSRFGVSAMQTSPLLGPFLLSPLEVEASPERAIAACARRRLPAILDSALEAPGGRYTILTWDPSDVFQPPLQDVQRVWNDFEAVLAQKRVQGKLPNGLPFGAGWIGFITYEAGAELEQISPREHPLWPAMRFHFYDGCVTWDATTSRWVAMTLAATPFAAERHAERIRVFVKTLADERAPGGEHGNAPLQAATPVSEFKTFALFSRSAYFEKIQRIKDYLLAGEVYQVNLTQRWRMTGEFALDRLYRRLRSLNPAPYAAMLPWGSPSVLSCSPELFLEVKGRKVRSRPIKGTRRRHDDPVKDAAAIRDLQSSEKERAELNMIIDLVRNDLSRICKVGSVAVADPGSVESLPYVHHRTATVEGVLRAGVTTCDLLKAAFPGGSVTGAPKVRAMQIIRELEPASRGVYCGALGWISVTGDLCLNLPIRTLTLREGELHLQVGGGIVADSVPESEYQECLDKATGLCRALGITLDG